MKKLSETALAARAKKLVEAMTEAERWVYALPRAAADSAVNILKEQGFLPSADDGETWVSKADDQRGHISLRDVPELEVCFLAGAGASVVEVMGAVLQKTGFFAQSDLLRAAQDLADPEAADALNTLAPMVGEWDGSWSELFQTHLEAADSGLRARAIDSLLSVPSPASASARELLAQRLEGEPDPDLRAQIDAGLAEDSF